MTQMALAQGIPAWELPTCIALCPDFFPIPAETIADPIDIDVAYEGQGGWSPHINVPRSRDASSSLGLVFKAHCGPLQ